MCDMAVMFRASHPGVYVIGWENEVVWYNMSKLNDEVEDY